MTGTSPARYRNVLMEKNPGNSPEAAPNSSPHLNSRPGLRIFGATELLSANGLPMDEILRRPKRLALLSYLVLSASGGFQRRDTVLGLFWPELDQERARGALRQALFGISKALGEGVITRRGTGEIGVDTSRLWCDAVEFERAFDQKKIAEALSLYRGDALVGLYVPGAGSDLEQWMADSRERLRSMAVNAALGLARDARDSDSAEVTRWATWAVTHARDDETVARTAMSLLVSAGDRAGALRTYENFAGRLRLEFEADPASETKQLAESIRNGTTDNTVLRVDQHVEAALPRNPRPVAATAVETKSTIPVRPPTHFPRAAIIGIVLIATTVLVVASKIGSGSKLGALRNHTVLVGPVISPRGEGIDEVAEAIPAMLTEKLGYVKGVRVIDRKRALELHANRHSSPDDIAAARLVARDAGADVIVAGALDAEGKGYVLTLRAEGSSHQGVIAETQVRGSNPSDLIERALGTLVPRQRSTSTQVNERAWRLYEDGLRALAVGQNRAASGLLAESFTLDSTHALGALYLNSALEQLAKNPSPDILRRAVQLASSASPVDKLRIQVRWADVTNDPMLGQLADSLIELAPNDPEAIFTSGMARIRSGDFIGAIPLFRKVVELDSTSRGGRSAQCLACRGLAMLETAYALADSSEVAARVQRELVAWQPDNADNWRGLSLTLTALGQLAEARVARDRQLELKPADSASLMMNDATIAIMSEDYDTADRLLHQTLASTRSTDDQKGDALWWLAISLRQQGRYREALSSILRMRALEKNSPHASVMLHEGQIYAETGDWKMARTMFDSASHLPSLGYDLASSYGRHRAWTLTHVARARIALGDTIGLAALADTVRNLGEMSSFGRDARLHHFIRAEISEQRGETAKAIDEYQKSIYSATLGFTCANFQLARLLIGRRRPREAIGVLRAALHGGRDASNLYVTATELHDLIATAFEMEGARDSASAHYAAVARAWKHADAPWKVRASAAVSRSIKLGAETPELMY